MIGSSLPSGLTTREAMVLGTAGYTAALSVIALLDHGLTPSDGKVLVTGATGGVGSTAVSMMSQLGYEVVASTGKPDESSFLTDLGQVKSLIDRCLPRPVSLCKECNGGAIDCVGGVPLANVLAQTTYGGAVAASGLTAGNGLPTTVLPFILRGVNLYGIDSVQTDIERRRSVATHRIRSEASGLDTIGHDIGLDELDGSSPAFWTVKPSDAQLST